MDLIFTPAYAQSAGGGGGDSFSLLFMMAAFGLIFYFLVFRPQQKRAREHQQMLDGLRRGDEVMTSGGLLAKVLRVKENEDEVEVEIAEGVRARLVKSTIAAVTAKPEPTKSDGGSRPARAGAKPAGKAGKSRQEQKPKPADAAEPDREEQDRAETAVEDEVVELKDEAKSETSTPDGSAATDRDTKS